MTVEVFILNYRSPIANKEAEVSEEIGLPREFIELIQDLIATNPMLPGSKDTPRTTYYWIPHYSQYLVDTIG